MGTREQGVGLTEEVSDRDGLSTLTNDAVDGEMRVDGSHLVQESLEVRSDEERVSHRWVLLPGMAYLGDSDDHVLDEGSDGSEASDVLSSSVPDREGDGVRLLDELNVHVDVSDVLVKNTSGSSHLDDSRLDGHSDALRDGKVFGLEDVLHLNEGEGKEQRRSVSC